MLLPAVWYIVTDISVDPFAFVLMAKQSKIVARRKVLVFYLECRLIQQFANFKYSFGVKGVLKPMLLWAKISCKNPLLLTSLWGKTLPYFLRNKGRESGMNLVCNCTGKFFTVFPRVGKTAFLSTRSLPTPGLSTKSYQFQIVLLTYSMEQSPSWEANWFCS